MSHHPPHDTDLALALKQRHHQLLDRVDDPLLGMGSLLEAWQELWPGWDLHTAHADDPDHGVFRSQTTFAAFTHPVHGWAVMALPDATRRWYTSPENALTNSAALSASGPDLLSVVERLHHDRPPYWTYTVARILTSPPLREYLIAGHADFLLALSLPVEDIQASADTRGWGPLFGSPDSASG